MIDESRSSRPIWLGKDKRTWDHVRIHVQLLADDRLGAYELSVYMGLVAHGELRSGRCYPAAATLAEYINASERQVWRSIRVLKEAGYVEVAPQKGKANTYYILPPPDTPATQAHLQTRDVRLTVKSGMTDSQEGSATQSYKQEPITRSNNKSEFNKKSEGSPMDETAAAQRKRAEEANSQADLDRQIDPMWELGAVFFADQKRRLADPPKKETA